MPYVSSQTSSAPGQAGPYGYLTRLRTPGRDTLVCLKYQLRPLLELAPDVPIPPVTKGTREMPGIGPKGPTPRTKRSEASDQKVRPLGPKGPTPLDYPLFERARELNSEREREEKRGGKRTAPTELFLLRPGITASKKRSMSARERWGACNGDFVVGDLLRHVLSRSRDGSDEPMLRQARPFAASRLSASHLRGIGCGWLGA